MNVRRIAYVQYVSDYINKIKNKLLKMISKRPNAV